MSKEARRGQALTQYFLGYASLFPRNEVLPSALARTFTHTPTHIDQLTSASSAVSRRAREFVQTHKGDSQVDVIQRGLETYEQVFATHIASLQELVGRPSFRRDRKAPFPTSGKTRTNLAYEFLDESSMGPVYKITLPTQESFAVKLYNFNFTDQTEPFASLAEDVYSMAKADNLHGLVKLVAHSFEHRAVVMDLAKGTQLDKLQDEGFMLSDEHVLQLVHQAKSFLQKGIYLDVHEANIFYDSASDSFTHFDYCAGKKKPDQKDLAKAIGDVYLVIDPHNPDSEAVLRRFVEILKHDQTIPQYVVEKVKRDIMREYL